VKPNTFGNLQEREKGFEPSTLALAIRSGQNPGGTSPLPDSPTLSHSEMLSPTAESNGYLVSQPMARFSAPNVDAHVDGVPEKQTSPLGVHRPRNERLLTVRRVAESLSVSRATVYKLVSSGALAHLRISNAIRVNNSELEAYLKDRRRSSRKL
jgi:excisionase family DNA binding protein